MKGGGVFSFDNYASLGFSKHKKYFAYFDGIFKVFCSHGNGKVMEDGTLDYAKFILEWMRGRRG